MDSTINSIAPTNDRSAWLIPMALVALGLVPALAGLVRLAGMGASQAVTPENARFVDMPVPIVVHIVSAVLFCLLGAFQFSAQLRRRYLAWHRIAGRVLVLSGLLAAGSGLWMTVKYSIDPQLQGPLLYFSRMLFGSAMLVSIVFSLLSVLWRDIAEHRAWMIRGYALGLGAGTQVLTAMPWMLVAGMPVGQTRDVLLSIAWVINMVVGEWIIHRYGQSS